MPDFRGQRDSLAKRDGYSHQEVNHLKVNSRCSAHRECNNPILSRSGLRRPRTVTSERGLTCSLSMSMSGTHSLTVRSSHKLLPAFACGRSGLDHRKIHNCKAGLPTISHSIRFTFGSNLRIGGCQKCWNSAAGCGIMAVGESKTVLGQRSIKGPQSMEVSK